MPNSLTRNGVQTRTTEVIVAKLASYLNADSYSDNLKSQIEYARQWIEQGEEATLSCSGLMKPDTHLGENARQIEVSDDQTTSFLFH